MYLIVKFYSFQEKKKLKQSKSKDITLQLLHAEFPFVIFYTLFVKFCAIFVSIFDHVFHNNGTDACIT